MARSRTVRNRNTNCRMVKAALEGVGGLDRLVYTVVRQIQTPRVIESSSVFTRSTFAVTFDFPHA